eukprot:g3618.t1
MKLIAAAFCVAAASAVAPPRIELQLDQTGNRVDSVYRSQVPFFQQQKQQDRQPNNDAVYNRQDWSTRCTVQRSNFDTCKLPVARAFDHQDRDISRHIRTVYYLADKEGEPCTSDGDANKCVLGSTTGYAQNPKNLKFLKDIFSERQTILVKYDVDDMAGNHAEQVVFLLEIDDRCGAECEPVITVCTDGEGEGTDEEWEAASNSALCSRTTARDQIPGEDLTSKLKYTIRKMNTDADGKVTIGTEKLCQWVNYADLTCANKVLTTSIRDKKEEEYMVTFSVCDNAFKYGPDAKSNCVQANKIITIRDNTPPVITVLGWGDSAGAALTWECHHDSGKAQSDNADADAWHPHLPKRNAKGVIVHDSGFYRDAGASVFDTLDTAKLFKEITPTASQEPKVDITSVGTYRVIYNAKDFAENPADEKTRVVNVRDSLSPRVTLDGIEFVKDRSETDLHSETTTHEADENAPMWTEPDWSCDDDCDRTGNGMKQAPTWDKPWNDRVIGDYFRTYTCKDESGNTHSARRKFTVVDKTIPIITVMGQAEQIIEATNKREYVDQGATCEDYVDGVLSHAVEVSGQVVNMRVPGNYTIQYDCQDLSSNKAVPMHRVVTIVDTTCPEIKMLGDSPKYIEAGFKYEDAGATAEDTLDGILTDKITEDGNTVNVVNAFHSARSCREILAMGTKDAAQLQSGMYYITVYHQDTASYRRQLVHCDMDSKIDGKAVGFTYAHCGSKTNPCATVKPYSGVPGSCAALGLEMIDWSGRAESCAWATKKYADDFPASFDCAAPSTHGQESPNYLCGTNDEITRKFEGKNTNTFETDHLFRKENDLVSEAEAGVYVIYYHVQDKAGNQECNTPSRTVIVKDTLPPVISLHLHNGKGDNQGGKGYLQEDGKYYIHMSKGDQTSRSDEEQTNPAGIERQADEEKGSNPFLTTEDSVDKKIPTGWTPNKFPRKGWKAANAMMAEASTSSNVWVFGAVASAVAGLALLAVSARKSQAATTVEV